MTTGGYGNVGKKDVTARSDEQTRDSSNPLPQSDLAGSQLDLCDTQWRMDHRDDCIPTVDEHRR